MSRGKIPGGVAVGDVDSVFRVPCRVASFVGNYAIAAAEGVFQVIGKLRNLFPFAELIDDVHPPAVLISSETEDLIEYVLRDGHRKRNGRFVHAHSFINHRYLLTLGREKGKLLAGDRLGS